MSLKIDRVQLEIVINSNPARLELAKLDERAAQLRRELKKLPEGTAEYIAKSKELKEVVAQYDKIIEKIGVTGLTMKELQRRATELKAILRNLDPNSAQFKELDTQLKAVNTRMLQLKGVNVQTGLSLSKIAEGMNRYIGLITVAAASLTGMVLGIRKAIDAYAQLDDKMADVMKTTGLTKDEVKGLDSELRKIDTRTSRMELLDLARVAGKLGITGKEDIAGFVRAANQLKVALTEDLGGDVEESINQVGKLSEIFKITDQYGTEAALLKIGSAINSLGAASTANEGYMVEFAKRVAGVAPQADISIQKVLGLAATLDQLGQTSEVSSTVFAAVVPDMFKDTSKYAAIAGMKVGDFGKLLKKDANEAFIRFLQGLNGNNGGLAEMANKLDGLGLEGKRSISVLGVLAANTEMLRQQQQLANQEFEAGTSITKEYNTKNESAQAVLEKARKGFQEMAATLGEKLMPIMTTSTNGVTLFMKALMATIGFVSEHRRLIITLATTIATYTIVVKAATLAKQLENKESKISLALAKLDVFWKNAQTMGTQLFAAAQMLLAGNIKGAAQAMRVFNSVMKANPWGLLLAGIAGLIAYLVTYKRELTATQIAQQTLNDVNQIAQQNIASEKLKLDLLLATARDETRSKQERALAIKQLNELSPDYLGNLTTENIKTNEATTAVNNYINSLEKKAKAQAMFEKLVELNKKELEIQSSPTQTTTWQDIKSGAFGTLTGTTQAFQMKYGLENKGTEIEQLKAQRELLQKEYNKLGINIFGQEEASPTNNTNSGGGGYTPTQTTATGTTGKQFGMVGSGKNRRFSPEQWKKDYEAWLANELGTASAEITNKLNKQLGIDEGDNAKDIEKTLKDTDKYLFDSGKSFLDQEYFKKKSDIQAEGSTTPEEKNKQMYDAEQTHLNSMKLLYQAYGESTIEIDKQIYESKVEYNNAIKASAEQRAKAEIEAGYQAGQAAVESAATIEEAAKNLLNSIRNAIKARISEAISIQLVKALETVPFPFNFAAAAAAGAAINLLFDTIVPQFAQGRYPVMGASDGRTYNATYMKQPKTGYYSSPTYMNGLGLVAERGKEIVISNPHVQHLQMNYPEVIRTIMATRVPQYATGKYTQSTTAQATGGQQQEGNAKEDMMISLMAKLVELNSRPFRGYITYNDVNDTMNEVGSIEDSVR